MTMTNNPRSGYNSGNRPRRQKKRSYGEAVKLYFHDADKAQLVKIFRALGMFFAGYAPFAVVNDAIPPFIGVVDDPTIPVGFVAAIYIWRRLQHYRSPNYLPRD